MSPLSAVNPDNPAPAKHTVTAQVTGIQRCAGGSGNDGTLCSNDADCTGGDICSDPSGVTVGFEIVSGPNAGDKGWTKTDLTGAATLNYTSNGIAGVDTIQACLDGDSFSPGAPDENTPLVSECITDSIGGGEEDFASNQVEKRWDPTLKLENLDLGATLVMGSPVYTTNPAYNPVGSTHTVRATIVGAASICFNTSTVSGSRTACNTSADCPTGETCGVAGYPVFFSVLAGSQNSGDLSGFVNTDSNGVATKTLSDPNLAGVDTIQACVDADVSEGIPDDTSFTQCLNDYQAGATTGQADIPSNTVVKNWLAKFVTGGGKVVNGKAWDTFGGVVGQKPGSATALIGEWQQVAHAAKGGNTMCHWNAFSAFALSCSIANCGAQPNTVVFTTAGGSLACGNETVKIVDGQKKPDTIQVIPTTNSALAVPMSSLVSGNFTIHK